MSICVSSILRWATLGAEGPSALWGRSTLAISANTGVLSGPRLSTQFEIITSTEWSGSGIVFDHAMQELDVLDARVDTYVIELVVVLLPSSPARDPTSACASGSST